MRRRKRRARRSSGGLRPNGSYFAAANAPLARQGLVSRRQMVVEGDHPADEILKRADEIGAELIAMGSHGRSGFLEFLSRQRLRKVLDRARCPVLVGARPERPTG